LEVVVVVITVNVNCTAISREDVVRLRRYVMVVYVVIVIVDTVAVMTEVVGWERRLYWR
jgi:hypothetical protein